MDIHVFVFFTIIVCASDFNGFVLNYEVFIIWYLWTVSSNSYKFISHEHHELVISRFMNKQHDTKKKHVK